MKTRASRKAGELTPKFKLWLSSKDAQGVFGDGKWRLLQAIDRKGSLKAASEDLRISYRKAWGDLEKAERCLGIPFIEKRRGGASGGETRLTEAGRLWLAAYAHFRSDIEKAVSKAFREHIARLGE